MSQAGDQHRGLSPDDGSSCSHGLHPARPWKTPPVKALVVAGASLGGMNTVQSARSAGYDGPICLVDPSPVLPHDRPPLTKQVLAGEWELERARQPVADKLAEFDVDLRLGGAAESLDVAGLAVGLDDGSRLDASAVVLATGSRARSLPDATAPGTHTLRTGADCLALRGELDLRPERVVVIGAGFIGAEVAATCRSRGLEVTMLEADEVPLGRVLPGGMGAFMADLHRSGGVDVRLGARPEAILTDDHGHTSGVRLDDGEVVPARVVVVGIGAVPAVDWLAGSALSLRSPAEGGGVATDATLLAAPGVVAVGDVASWPNPLFDGEVMRVEHWENAIDQGAHAGRRVLAELDPKRWDNPGGFSSVPWFWSDQYDSKIQMVGRARPGDEPVVVSGAPGEDRFVVLYRRGGWCTAALGLNRPRDLVRARMAMSESLAWDGVASLF